MFSFFLVASHLMLLLTAKWVFATVLWKQFALLIKHLGYGQEVIAYGAI